MYHKELYEKKVLYVSDLFNANNKLMSYSELKEKYKTNINRLHYMGLIQTIPTRYKQILLEKNGVCNDNIDRIMQQKEKVIKLIYETKLERNKQFPEKAFLKIKALLETEMARVTFLNYFNLAKTDTTPNKLR